MHKIFKALTTISLLTACNNTGNTADPLATITFTDQYIPHVKADDMIGLGYGSGYAAAKVDLCAVADTLLTYAGKKSAVYGAQATTKLYIPRPAEIPNLLNDLTINYSISSDKLLSAKEEISGDMRSLLQGYAKGFNQYLHDTPVEKRPADCNQPGEIPDISENDLIMRGLGYSMLLGERLFMHQIYSAAPPNGEPSASNKQEKPLSASFAAAAPSLPVGSNAYAFGHQMTENGSGLLMANPHYTWAGHERFMQIHLSAPDYDAMGVAMLGMPMVGIGFNSSLAWTHTVATDAKATLFQLTLSPDNPTAYMMDGQPVSMKKREVSINVKQPDGTMGTISHTFWETEFGPIVEGPGLPWNQSTAYALSDPNKNNFGLFDQSLAIGQSKTVKELKEVLTRYVASPFLNTVATDSQGEVLYANMAVTPGFDLMQLQTCSLHVPSASAYFTAHIMDGAKSACKNKTFADAPRPGILPASQKPVLVRDDYVANSNASHWYTHPEALMTGYSPLIGSETNPLNARTRLAHKQVAELKAQGTKANHQIIEAILFSNRNYMAELLTDDLVSICKANTNVNLGEETVNLSKACSILDAWDRRDDLESVGAALFREFLKRAPYYGPKAKDFWSIPFDPADPLNTPAGIQATNSAVPQALAKAVLALKQADIPIDAHLGEVQHVTRNGQKLPIHGGPDASVFNVMEMSFINGKGYTDPVFSGATYIAVVGFEDGQPVADAILASGQTSNPQHSHFKDGLQTYSEKRWLRLPFSQAEINASMIEGPIQLHHD